MRADRLLRLACASALAATPLAHAGDVSYRCKDRDGTWSVEACSRAAPPHAASPAPNESADAAAARLATLRARYVAMCGARIVDDAARERCADDQMAAQAFVLERLRGTTPGSVEAQQLSACIARATRRELDLLDAVAAKRCFVGAP